MALAPMLAVEQGVDFDAVLQQDRWALEEKLDGHRLLLAITANTTTAYNRNGAVSQHQARFESAAWQSQWSWLEDRHAIIDGELLNGLLHAFDLPVFTGLVTTRSPWQQRRAALARLGEAMRSQNMTVIPSATTTDEKIALAQDCLARNAEGLIVKDVTAPYRYGQRCAAFVKIKFVKTVDCVVTHVGADGRHNAVLAVFCDGVLTEVGRCSLLHKPPVRSGDVVEVRYLYLTKHRRLYQPRLVRIRDDKDATACTDRQFDSWQRSVW